MLVAMKAGPPGGQAAKQLTTAKGGERPCRPAKQVQLYAYLLPVQMAVSSAT